MKEKLLNQLEELKNIVKNREKNEEDPNSFHCFMGILFLLSMPISIITPYVTKNKIILLIISVIMVFLFIYVILIPLVMDVLFPERMIKEKKAILLNKEQIVYFYKPLHEFFGKDTLIEKMSTNSKNDKLDEREIGDISLVICLYETAIKNIKEGEIKEKRFVEINSVLEEKE